jgi:hypothetical protein
VLPGEPRYGRAVVWFPVEQSQLYRTQPQDLARQENSRLTHRFVVDPGAVARLEIPHNDPTGVINIDGAMLRRDRWAVQCYLAAGVPADHRRQAGLHAEAVPGVEAGDHSQYRTQVNRRAWPAGRTGHEANGGTVVQPGLGQRQIALQELAIDHNAARTIGSPMSQGIQQIRDGRVRHLHIDLDVAHLASGFDYKLHVS